MIYYIIVFIYTICSLSEIFSAVKIKNRNVYAFFLLLPLWFLAAFRAESVGADTWAYKIMYEITAQYDNLHDLLEAGFRYERGFVFLMFVCCKLGFSYFQFQVLTETIIWFVLYRIIIRKSPNIGLACLISLIIIYPDSVNILRQCLAMAIICIAFRFIKKKKLVIFALFVLLATMFHRSAIFGLFLYPLFLLNRTHKNNKRFDFIVIASAFVILPIAAAFAMRLTIFLDIYFNYAEYSMGMQEGFSGVHLVSIIFYIMVLVVFNRYSSINSNNFFLEEKDGILLSPRVAHISFLTITALTILGLRVYLLGRITLYLKMFLPILLPILFSNIKIKDIRQMVYVFVLFYYVLYFVFILIPIQQSYCITPYEFGFRL